MKFFKTSKYHTFKKSTYISLRWIGIVGQLIAVNFVYFFLNFEFDFITSNLVIFVGKNTKGLYDVSKSKIECTWAIDAEQVIKTGKMDIIKPMDTILVKGSRYMKMEVIVNYLIAKYKTKAAD